MIVIKCAKCKRKIFRYLKVGKGKLWHCWKDKITEDNSVRDRDEIKCHCGNLVGIDEGKWIKIYPVRCIISGLISRNRAVQQEPASF
jgi:hypothetical protein